MLMGRAAPPRSEPCPIAPDSSRTPSRSGVSCQDAEDLVQETYLRAWRFYGGFEGRSSVRTWLYQIATNRCLTELARYGRRVLPSGLCDPEPDPGTYPEEAGAEVTWLQPAPDAMVTPHSADPAAVVAAREGLRLALIASPPTGTTAQPSCSSASSPT